MKNLFCKGTNKLSWIVSFVVIAWSCQNENISHQSPVQVQDQIQTTAMDNIQVVSSTQDIMDVTAGALAGQGVTNESSSSYGRVTGTELDCAPSISGSFSIDRSHPDSVIYSGSITIDYGNGSSCKDSTEIRKGRITDSFVLNRKIDDIVDYNLTETVTFQGFQKDTIQVDGTFISKSSSGVSSTLNIQNAKITYSDGTFVAWSGTLMTTLVRALVPIHPIPLANEWERNDTFKEVTGSINGTSRSGANFSAAITNAVVFRYSCSRNIPVSGTIDLAIGSNPSIIDFGAGVCDNIYTITTDGKTTTYTFKRHHRPITL